MTGTNNKQWYAVNADHKNKHAEINLYGVVGGWRLNLHSFLDEIAPYKNFKTLTVNISTVGGTFMDGLPIYNILKQHKAEVTTVNMGYALSMGSVIMLAGDIRKSAQNAIQMLHSPNHGICDYFNAQDHHKAIRALDTHQGSMLPRYQEVLNLSAEEVTEILEAETWYTADEAKAAGLIQDIIDPVDFEEIEESMTEDHWGDIVKSLKHEPPAAFMERINQNLPEATTLLKALKQPKPSPSANSGDKQDDDMTPEQMEDLKASLKAEVESAVTAAMAGSEAKLDQKFSDMAESLKPSIEEEGEQTEMKTSLEDAGKKLDSITDDLKAQKTALEGITETVTAMKALPVNQRRLEQHGNRENEGNENDENKATYS